jgi:histidinol-phosphatase (PHP family)
MRLPADAHVHTEWSWDTGGPGSHAAGRMRGACIRAVAIGLPAVVFTEHLDFDANWRADSRDLMPHQEGLLAPDGFMSLPVLDIAGYLRAIDECRRDFPQLRILTGVEFGQPHLHHAEAAGIDLDLFDRVNGSLHTLAVDDARYEPLALYRMWPADRVIREYLRELARMVGAAGRFEVVTHIDYAVRAWPTATEGPFDPWRFEQEFRGAMRAIADSGRALEMNTRQLRSWIPQWWSEEGGSTVSFGSDAHAPEALASSFPEAVTLLEEFGFRAGTEPEDLWRRVTR